MKIFKKLISVLIASCFMISIVNLPAYSAQSTIETIGTAQNQEEYNLQAEYKTVKETTQATSTKKESAASKVKTTKVSASIKKLATQGINAINKLLKKKGISKLAKTWLKKAKTLINSIKNGKKTNAQKAALLKKAIASIKKVSKAKGSDLVLAQQTTGVFSTLKSVLKNNLTYKIYSKYTTTGLTVLKEFANKLGFKLKTVYNAFVKIGVTKANMKKAGPLVLKLLKKGERFVNCAALAVSKYLGISRNMAAVYNLAADMTLADMFVRKNSKGFVGTINALKTIQKNGYKNAETYRLKLNDFISGLKKGQKALIHVTCKNGGGHAVTVTREKNGKFGVYDINRNGGNKVIYTKSQFTKLMNGSSYYKGTDKEGFIFLDTHSKSIAKKDEEYKLKNSNAYKLSKETISSINKLLENKNLNNIQTKWLKEAKTLISKTINSSKSLEDKHWLIVEARETIKDIVKSKASILSLVKASSVTEGDFSSNIFYSLRTVLKDNIMYKIYTKYGEDAINLISKLSKNFNLTQTALYNQFIKNGVKKEELLSINDVLKQIEQEESFFAGDTKNSDINELIKHYDNLKEQTSLLQKSSVGESIEQLSSNAIAGIALKYEKKLEENNNNLTYKMHIKYGDKGVNLISALSEKFSLNQSDVYDIFLNNGVTKEEMDFIAGSVLSNLSAGGNFFNWRYRYTSINNALAAIKGLVEK